MAKEQVSKQGEIDQLSKLHAGQGYFYDEFTYDELTQMAYNIQNDFPIFHKTHIEDVDNDIKVVEKALKGACTLAQSRLNQIKCMEDDIRTLEAKQEEMLETLMDETIDFDDHQIVCIAKKLFGEYTVVRYKIRNNIQLCEKEITLVLDKF